MKEKLANFYFKYPILIDLLVCSVACFAIETVFYYNFATSPSVEKSESLLSDLTSSSITVSGFVLTILTVLVSFKSASKTDKSSSVGNHSLFEIFFATNLYFDSVKLLKKGIIITLVFSVFGFLLQGFSASLPNIVLRFATTTGSILIGFTLFRSLYVIAKIIGLDTQETTDSDSED